MIRLLLAEDQGLIGSALAALLALEDDLEVVGQVSTVAEIVPAVRDCRPDVALLDIEFEDGAPSTSRRPFGPWRRAVPSCSSPPSGAPGT